MPPAADSDEEPIPPEPGADETIVDGQPPDINLPPDDPKRGKIYVDGVAASIIAQRVEYLDENGKLVTESLRDYTKKALRKRFASLDDFLSRWNAAQRKQAIIEELASEGLPLDPLAEEVGKDFDPFDLICHVAFDRPPLSRRERAENVRKRDVFTKYGPQARAVLEALLQKYQDEGVLGIDDPRILQVPPLRRHGHAAGADQAVRNPRRLRAGRPRTASRPLSRSRLNLKSQISDLKSEISNLRFEISKSQIAY